MFVRFSCLYVLKLICFCLVFSQNYGESALHIAVSEQAGCLDIVKILVSAGADMELRNYVSCVLIYLLCFMVY